MPEKKNQLWRLDLLETNYLQKPPRYSRTKALLRVKGKNRTHLLPESEDQALKEIEALQRDIFSKKLHSSLVKYQRGIKKCLKALVKKSKDDDKKFLESVDIELVSNVRIIKLIMNIYNLNPKKKEFPTFIPSWIIDVVKDKSNKMNPSNLYNSMSASNRNIYSKLMNMKDIQSITDIIENSFKVILGAVEKEKKDIEDVETSESSSDEDSNDENSSEEENIGTVGRASEDIETRSDDEFAQFDNMVAGSDEDDSDVELDKTINYNEVTDEEPSDESDDELEKNELSSVGDSESEDDFFVDEPKEMKKSEKKEKNNNKSKKEKIEKIEKKKAKKKVQLPELQIGYVSGSEDEYDDDVVKQITQPKKNRRGQRARQKIWEAKYGRGAKHIQKEKEKVKLEREQRQREYEERVAKRATKAAITGSNNVPLGERKSGESGKMTVEDKPQGLHPSWEAKKKQEEALKNVKFSGKKIVF